MKHRQLVTGIRRIFYRHRLAQGLTLCALWGLGEALARALALPLPGSIVGLALALAALLSGGLAPDALALGAQWFLDRLMLFFVPAVVGIVAYPQLFGLLGLKILLIIVLGTVSVMGATAFGVELVYRLRIRHASRRHLG